MGDARASVDARVPAAQIKPQEESAQQERSKVDDIRGSPMGVATLEEMVDDNHAIISSSIGPEYYVNIMSFVDKDQLEPGSSLLTHHKVTPQSRPPRKPLSQPSRAPALRAR